MIDGYLYISRNLQDNWLWTAEPFTKGQAWVDLIMMANYQSGHLLVRGVKVEVLRGQVGRSEDTLCKRWRWSKSKLRNYLKMLETDQQIKQQKSNIINVITIINYDIYQKPYNKTETKKKTEGKQKDTNNKEKEQISTNNEGIEYPDWLDLDLWANFVEHRKFIKAPMSIQAAKVNLASLEKLTSKGYSQAEIINLAIGNGWKGFYEPKGNQNGTKQTNGQYHKPTQGQEIDAAIARLEREYGLSEI